MKRLLLTISALGTFGMMQAQTVYPLLPIDSVQFVNQTKLANPTANTRPDYVDPVFKNPTFGDTVRVEGIVVTNPRIYGLSQNRRAAYIQRKGGGPWSGMLVMCNHETVGAPALNSFIQETKFYENFIVGFPVRVTGILREFPNPTGDTQLNLIRNTDDNDNSVVALPNRDTLVYSTISAGELMSGNPNTGWVQQKETAEQWESVLVEIRDVTVYTRQINTTGGNNGRTFWSVIDDFGNVIDIRDFSSYLRNAPALNQDSTQTWPFTFTAPPVGTRLEYIRGLVTEYAVGGVQRYGLAPIWPGDIKVCTSCPPIIRFIRRTPVVATSSDTTVLVFEVTSGDTTLRTMRLHFNIDGGAMDSVALTPVSGFPNTFSASIPPQTTESIVTYWLRAEDNRGRQTFFPDPLTIGQSFLTTPNGINSIATLQRSVAPSLASIWSGDSIATMNVRGIVTGRNFVAGQTNLTTIQSGTGPNSAIFIQRAAQNDAMADWEVGDSVQIISGRVTENFNVTTLFNIRGNKISSGNALPAFETGLPIDSFRLNRVAFARPWEGVLMRFEDVFVTNTNPDAPGNFNEFAFNTDSSLTVGLRVDDMNAELRTLSSRVRRGMAMDFVQGPMYFSFGNFKLIPRGLDDVDLSRLDSIAPEITILGNNPDSVRLGGTWTDAGATAIDDIDGDITDRIEVSGTVNTAVAGTYVIQYKATDNWGNSDSVERVVIVYDPAVGLRNELLYAQLQVFPNPASSALNIKGAFVQSVPVKVELVDMLGKSCLERTYTDTKFEDQIDISSLNNGVYFVKFTNDGGSRTLKLMISK
jgi:hypothetical protein